MIIPKRQMGCDSQLTVKPRKNSASLVDIILFSSCQMHPTKQEVHPTFRPVHPTCRIVSKWPTFSRMSASSRFSRLLAFLFSSEQVPNHPASRQPKSASSCNPDVRKYLPWLRSHCDQAIPESASWEHRLPEVTRHSYVSSRDT